MPVVKTSRPAETRSFYERFLGFRVAMEEDGMFMLASTSTPTTQLIVAWESPTAVDPELLGVDISIEVAEVDAALSAPGPKASRSCASRATSRGGSADSSFETRPAGPSTSPATFRAVA